MARPGGGVAFMVWGPEADNTLLYHGMRAANDFLGRPIAARTSRRLRASQRPASSPA